MGPLEDAMSDPFAAAMMFMTMLPFAAMIAGGVSLLIELAWRSL